MELHKQVDRIQYCQKQILDLTAQLDEAGEAKARTERDYDKAMQTALIELQDKGTRAAEIKDLAKGMIADQKYAMVLAEVKYKAINTKIEANKSVMNAQQSIFRHME